MRETLLCEVVDDGFGWFDELVVYNDARLVVDHADPGQFLAVFCQALPRAELEWPKKRDDGAPSRSRWHILSSVASHVAGAR